MRVICLSFRVGTGAAGAGGGAGERELFELVGLVFGGGAGALGGIVVEPRSAFEVGLDRGFGDWIFGVVCFVTGGDSSSDDSDFDSDSDEDEEDEELEESSLLSRYWNTSGTFFIGSTGLSAGDSGVACDLRALFGPLDLFSLFLEASAGPACVDCVVLEMVDKALFLPSFVDLRVKL